MVGKTEPLTQCEKEEVFRQATSGLVRFHSAEIKAGMTDEALEAALKRVLGIFGGSGGPDILSITYQGAGLKIWGGRETLNHVLDPPLFAGQATVQMARYLYGISDPDDMQMSLF